MKRFKVLFLTFLLVVSSVVTVQATVSDYNMEINVEPVTESVLSGKQSYLKLEMKSTGSRITFTNVELKFSPNETNHIDYDTASLDEMIVGVFDSYTIIDGELILKASQLDSGKFYELPIRFSSENGLVPNDTKVSFNVTFSSTELTKDPITTSLITIESSSPLKINKKYEGMSLGTKNQAGMFWYSDSYWNTKAAIDFKSEGQEFILEGSQIRIVETYHENLKYLRMHEGPEPVVDLVNRTLTWTFDAPSYATQKESTDALFSEDLMVVYTTDGTYTSGVSQSVDVNAVLTFTNISGIENKDESSSEALLYAPRPEEPELHGNWNVFGHWGPTNASGNFGYQSTADMNVQPVAFPNGTLTFAHRMSSLYVGRFTGFDDYIFNYLIDDYLELESLHLPSDWVDFPTGSVGVAPLVDFPEYDIYLLNKKVELDLYGNNAVNAEDTIAVLKFGVDFQHGEDIDIKSILQSKGIASDQHIAQVRYQFTYAPAGMFSLTGVDGTNMFRYQFKINPDWRESSRYDVANDKTTLSNDITVYTDPKETEGINTEDIMAEIYDYREDTISGKNVCSSNQPAGESSWFDENGVLISCMYTRRNEKYDRSGPGGFDQTNHWGVNANRTAFVTSDPNVEPPTVSNTIELVEESKGEIFTGDNVLKVVVDNSLLSSIGPINKGGLDSYLLIPNSISVDINSATAIDEKGRNVDFELTLTDQKQSNYNIYKIVWVKDSKMDLIAGSKLILNVDVNVSDKYQDLSMHVLTDLPNNNDFNVFVGNPAKPTDTIIISDELDLASKGKDYKLMKSSNAYHVVSDYYIITNKLVKGSLDADFVKSGTTTLSGDVHYRLEFTNKEGRNLTSFTLLDVLPSVDDLGITDGVGRGSEFGLSLKEAVKIDDRFTVLYSESKNPDRELLNESLSLSGFEKITNPDSVENPNWKTADAVTDWSTIHSFIIQLNVNESIKEDEVTSIEFVSQIDARTSDTTDLIAWNSFAYTVNGKPVVEPLRVPVVLEAANIIKTEISVQKEWVGGTSPRPDITVQLLQNGNVIDEVVLNDSNEWKHTWGDLTTNDDSGNKFMYTVDELYVPDGYEKSIDGFVITNTFKEEPVKPIEPEIPVTPVDPEVPVKPADPQKPELPTITETTPVLPNTGVSSENHLVSLSIILLGLILLRKSLKGMIR